MQSTVSATDGRLIGYARVSTVEVLGRPDGVGDLLGQGELVLGVDLRRHGCLPL